MSCVKGGSMVSTALVGGCHVSASRSLTMTTPLLILEVRRRRLTHKSVHSTISAYKSRMQKPKYHFFCNLKSINSCSGDSSSSLESLDIYVPNTSSM